MVGIVPEWPYSVDNYQLLAHLLVLNEPAFPVGNEAAWMQVVALARAERVAPLLHRAVLAIPGLEVPAAVGEALAKSYLEALCISMLQQSVRARLCRRLAERGIPTVLLKGGALAFTCYDDPATRPMADLDVLVPRSRVEDAAECLEEAGFQPHNGTLAMEMRNSRSHIIYVHAGTGLPVEVHWELKALGRAHSRALPEIWRGARPAGEDTAAQTLRPGHMIPFLCAHMTIQHHRAQLLWLYDLHRVLLKVSAEEAAEARDAAERWRLAPSTAQTILRVQTLFGTPLPEALGCWAVAAAGRDGLQARVAALALSPNRQEIPDHLLELLMHRNWSLLRTLFPTPRDLRLHLGIASHESVTSAYLSLLARRLLRNAPTYFAQLWRCWRAAPALRPPAREAASAGAAPKPCSDAEPSSNIKPS
jgi:Uncharacterised nucleotidyltransferase